MRMEGIFINENKRPVVALTGASGYIGQNLLEKITEKADVIALSRNGENKENTTTITWRSCDFFSLRDAEEGLRGADYAVYLIHSMKPSARLTQAKFEDMDVLLADNFARAAKKNGIKQIIYLSGIIPEGAPELSRHLKSRLEVEKILQSYGIPVTTIRAGLIVGPKGSSFPILSKLVKRLPVMLLPKWTRTKTHPVAIKDVIHSLAKTIGSSKAKGRAIDIGGPEVMSYKEMMIQTAEVMGRNPRLFDLPFMTINLSRLWVTLITDTPKETAYPLIESLQHPMVAQEENKLEGFSEGVIPFKEAAASAFEADKQSSHSMKPWKAIFSKSSSQSDVRSVQRVKLPEEKDANWAGLYYTEWLAKLARPFVRAEVDEDRNCQIYLKSIQSPILELTYINGRSDFSRALYFISGGIFAKVSDTSRGRLEFRLIPDTRECIIAIHEFRPALPWTFYKYTQAKIHLFVMYLFKQHLLRLINKYNRTQDHSPGHVN